MMHNSLGLFLFALALSAPLGQAGELTDKTDPIAKVIEMLSDLQQKIIKEGEAAQKTYDEFAEWCEEESRNLGFSIKTAKAEVEDLSATIEKATSDIKDFDAKIEELSATIASDEADLKAATAIREKEQTLFEAEETDLMETVDILERAVGILERELGKGSASFVQLQKAGNLVDSLKAIVAASTINTRVEAKLNALLQTKQDSDDSDVMLGAPDPATYESHSGGIIDTLNDLLEKAQSELDEARKVESDNKNNYELLKLELEDAIKFANKELGKCKKGKAASAETKGKAEGDLAVVMKGLSEDMHQLADTHHDCMEKATEFETETKARAAELKALAEAKKVIIEMTGGAAAQTYGLIDSSFLQVSATSGSRLSTRADLANFEAVRFVKSLSRKLRSTALAQLAAQMSAAARFGASNGEDPFAKVKGLISEMIERLLKEAEEDAAHKGYCDKEMSETKAKKAELEGEIEKLTTKIDEMTAKSKKLKEEVAILQKELAELAATQAEMDKIREEEHSQYVADKAEMDEGLEGIKLALKILRDHYGGGGGAQGAGGGIIAMLEVIEADFTKGLEEMIAAEEAAQEEYDKISKENEIAKTTKEQDVKYKTKEAKELDTAVAEGTADRDGLNTELQAVLDYYEKLKPQCIAKPEPYEERKKRREAEIAGLKEALGILEGTAVLIQRHAHRHHALRGGSLEAK